MERLSRCLLIGNSRWHWAEKQSSCWHYFHSEPELNNLKSNSYRLSAWASVGEVPQNFLLEPSKELSIKDVPLKGLPPWLGIDRALGAWSALKKAQAKQSKADGLIVADAGTIFSITLLEVNGQFLGGQLVPGLNLQLEAMAKRARNLKHPGLNKLTNEKFPKSTGAAMQQGSIQALIGILIEANREKSWPIWLCGGDSSILFDELKKYNIEVIHYPNLVLEGMINLISTIN